jgi:hypothetical protein
MNTAKAVRALWRPAVLGLALTATLAATAFAAISTLTLDPTAQLSPGRLHATLTGMVTCDPSTTTFLTGQVIQPKVASGFGTTTAVCDGTAHPYTIDVSSGGIFGTPTVFKPGKANAQVSTAFCNVIECTTEYTDAEIRLTK